MKTHYKRLVNPDYFGAYSLPPGEGMTVKIKRVSREVVTSVGGKKEELVVAALEGQKPLILNRTNMKSISNMFGPYIEDWTDKEITLYATETRFGNEMVECVRIRHQSTQKEMLTDERFNKALEAVRIGRYTKDKMREKFQLTKVQNKILDEAKVAVAS